MLITSGTLRIAPVCNEYSHDRVEPRNGGVNMRRKREVGQAERN